MLRCLALATSLLLSFPLSSGPASSQTVQSSGGANWSGMYVGAFAGYGWMDLSIVDGGTQIANPPYGAFACGPALTGNYCNTPFELAPGGLTGGLHLGVSRQTGNLVLGLEGDVGWIDIDAEKTLVRPFNDRDIASAALEWHATLTGKVGLAFQRALYYVRGGAAFARAHTNAADIDLGGSGFEIYQGSLVSSKELLRGWALGAGMEYAISPRLSLRAEYLYMNFGSFSERSPEGDIYDHDVALHTARLGLSYRLLP